MATWKIDFSIFIYGTLNKVSLSKEGNIGREEIA